MGRPFCFRQRITHSDPAISVNGNWRLTFGFKDGNAYVLDYEDYH